MKVPLPTLGQFSPMLLLASVGVDTNMLGGRTEGSRGTHKLRDPISESASFSLNLDVLRNPW